VCDFHSVIVTGNGRILHLASNSHSDIARHNGLESGIDAKWWECEWNGRGSMPLNLVQNRRDGQAEPTKVAERAAESHYKKLALIVAGDLDPATTFPFDQPEYSDVRAIYAEATAVRQAEPMAAQIESLDTAAQIAILRAIAENLSLDMADVAAEEIQAAEESAEERGSESSYESGYEAGVNAASEEMYSYEYMQEEIESAVKKAVEEATEEAQAESYEEGYRDCQQGKAPAYAFLNGLPSFLI
jgi:hypothetical protein